jgi:hypothetical protein
MDIKMKHTLGFRFEKETKGAIQYKEYLTNDEDTDKENMIIGTLYVRKSAMEKVSKQDITVTIDLP